jgi:hypothetical protein
MGLYSYLAEVDHAFTRGTVIYYEYLGRIFGITVRYMDRILP